MKSFLLVLAVCFSAAAAFPAPHAAKAVDWAAVAAKVGEIRTLTSESLAKVKETASNDNEQVGSDIAVKIDEAAQVALGVLAEAEAEIEAQTLTAASAEAYLKRLETLLLETQAAVKPDVDKLSAAAAEAIRAVFADAYLQAQAKAQELYALLEAKQVRAIDWAAVTAKVGEIRTLTSESLGKVKETASNDNEQVGSDIAVKIDEAAQVALGVLAEAEAEIEAQTLTAASAEAYLKRLETLLLETQAAVKPDVDKLSPAAAEAIRAVFTDAYVQAQAKAQELYALLEAKQVRAVDWAAVAAKVGEIRTLTSESLGKVKETASNDNEQVGSDIAVKIDEAAQVALGVLAEAEAEIEGQTLTAASAEAYLKRLETLLLETQAAVKPDVDKLSPAAAEAIRAVFTDAYVQAQAKAQELYALLEAKQVRAIDWAAVAAKVGEIRTLTSESLAKVKETASNDNEQVGSDIAVKIDEAAQVALGVLAEAQAEIDGQTLTDVSAKAYLQRLETLLLETQANVKPDVDKLSAAAAEAIRAVFTDAYVQAQAKAEELYTLLKQ